MGFFFFDSFFFLHSFVAVVVVVRARAVSARARDNKCWVDRIRRTLSDGTGES